MKQMLEKIIIPKKHDYFPAIKTAKMKIITENNENSLNAEIINEVNPEHLVVNYNPISAKKQKNRLELERLEKKYAELMKSISAEDDPETVQKSAQAQTGLLQLLYEHTSVVLEDQDNYEHPKKNGKIKHDLLIEQDRMYYATSRIKIHARRFKQLFDALTPLMDDVHFGDYEEKVKEIEGNVTMEKRCELIYELAITARENMPEKVETIHDEYEEPTFDMVSEPIATG